ncbi:MAG: DUF554 domain-containing protein [Oscillospiraceae bacterium]|nr:DUF554 domain-containing protein [Oscillospiraceae bacterium]
MIATIVNALLVLVGSMLGIFLRGRLSANLSLSLTRALGLCVMVIGVQSAVSSKNLLCIIICMVLGILLGEALRIEDRLDNVGELLRRKLVRKRANNQFTEGFVSASVLFCVGSMAIMGSLEAGLNHNYTILISKGVIDGVTAITLSASMGIGVAFSAIPLLLYQGALTLLSTAIGPLLAAQTASITELSAVGGTVIMGIAFNMLQLSDQKIRAGNMLPAVFLPLVYVPFAQWIQTVFFA